MATGQIRSISAAEGDVGDVLPCSDSRTHGRSSRKDTGTVWPWLWPGGPGGRLICPTGCVVANMVASGWRPARFAGCSAGEARKSAGNSSRCSRSTAPRRRPYAEPRGRGNHARDGPGRVVGRCRSARPPRDRAREVHVDEESGARLLDKASVGRNALGCQGACKDRAFLTFLALKEGGQPAPLLPELQR
jgi:hypothetical protein